MKLNKEDIMEEKLAKLEDVIVKVGESNLDEESKKIILELVRKETFALRSEISVRNQNIETVFPKGK